jgi:hypothetical protein
MNLTESSGTMVILFNRSNFIFSLAPSDWSIMALNTIWNWHSKIPDQTQPCSSFSLNNFPATSRTREEQISTKIIMRITVRKVWVRGSRICTWFILIIPKSPGSNELGFHIKASNRNISLYNHPFHKPRLALHSTLNTLSNAYNNSSIHEIRKFTLIGRQWWILELLHVLIQNSSSWMIGKVNATCSLARICS